MTDAIDTAFRRLEGLDIATIESTGDWGLGRMFAHLAQGVDFSLSGYPEHKPRLFQATVGKLAFTVFDARGRMSHGLNEPIPGETITDITTQDGLSWLWRSLEAFRDHDGPLQPHFAYGPLSKPKFARAHLLHIDNHLVEVHTKHAHR